MTDIENDLGELRRLQSVGETRSMTDAAARLAVRAVVSGEFESVRARFRTVDRDLWPSIRGGFNGAAALARYLSSDGVLPLPNRQRKQFLIESGRAQG